MKTTNGYEHSENWFMRQDIGEYVDFERDDAASLHLDGISQITLVPQTRAAYATEVNPDATLDNFEPVHGETTKSLTWDEALEMLRR